METPVVTIPLDQLLQVIGNVVEEKIDANNQKQQGEKLLTTNDVLAILGISKPTLLSWIESKRIPVYKVDNGKNFFIQKEVMECLLSVKKYSRPKPSENGK